MEILPRFKIQYPMKNRGKNTNINLISNTYFPQIFNCNHLFPLMISLETVSHLFNSYKQKTLSFKDRVFCLVLSSLSTTKGLARS